MALLFDDALSQYLERSGTPPATAVPLSIAAWFYSDDAAASQQLAACVALTNNENYFSLHLGAGVVRAEASATAGGGEASATGSYALNTWSHGAAVFASTTSRTVYLNGSNEATNTTSVTPGTLDRTSVGRLSRLTAGRYMSGRIAEVAIWSVALGSKDVTALAAGYTPDQIRPASLVAYYTLFGTDVSSERDYTGDFDLALFNSPTKASHPRRYARTCPKVATPYALVAPVAPSDPTPSDGSLGTPTILHWSAGATSYDIYFGTVSGALSLLTGQSSTTYELGALSVPVTYYWQIVAINAGGSTAGPEWSFTTVDPASLLMTIAGLTPSTRVSGFHVSDQLNDQPNVCSFLVDTTPPTLGSEVLVGLGSLAPATLMFAGTVVSVDQTFEGVSTNRVWSVRCQDYTARLNRRRPFGHFVNVSATTVAQSLIATYAPGFTSTYVEASLPTVSITFDGERDFAACLSALASQIGGYWYVDYVKALHFFLEETTDLPDDVTADTVLADRPPRISTDLSQVRTRVFVKAHGEAARSAVITADTVVPVADTVMFQALGGQAVASGQRLTYAGVQVGGGGAIVGAAVAPTNAPTVTRTAGAGLSTGEYRWAVGYYDGTGTGLPGPTSVAVGMGGTIAAPTLAPSIAAKGYGGALTAGGSYRWKITNRDANGNETTPSDASVDTAMDGPSAPSSIGLASFDNGSGGLDTGVLYGYKYTFWNGTLETLPSPAATMTPLFGLTVGLLQVAGIETPPSGYTVRFYRTVGGGSTYKLHPGFASIVGQWYSDTTADASLGADAPSSSTAILSSATIRLPVSPDPATASRRLYRSLNGGTFELVTTIANNTAVEYLDLVADASLGADAPTTNTTSLARATITLAIGPSGTVGRIAYRTAVNGSQLKVLATIANNTATSYADLIADGSLGANAPTVDTSLIVAPDGEVAAGSVTLPVTSVVPFSTTGGWADVGQMALRYTGITGATLSGIPPSGTGSILTTIKYREHVTALPALTGVTGLTSGLLLGEMVHILVIRDDTAAQAALALLTDPDGTLGHDGIVEHYISDGRIREDTAQRWADADLARFSHPIVTVQYATRDTTSKSGKAVSIELPALAFDGDFVIQTVEISEVNVVPGRYPRYDVTASSVKFNLDDVLRRLVLASGI